MTHLSRFLLDKGRNVLVATAMNLSRYFQLPPATSPSGSPQAPSGLGSKAFVGTSAAEGGLDFASLMTQQLQHLQVADRQDIAAPVAEAIRTAATSRDKSAEKASALPRQPVRVDRQTDASSTDEPDSERPTNARSTRRPPVARTAERPELDMVWGMQALNALPSEATMAGSSLQGGGMVAAWQEQRLSSNVTLITDPRHQPNAQSLESFAQSMGMDAEAIRQLLARAQGPASVNATASEAGLTTSKAMVGGKSLEALTSNPQGTPVGADAALTKLGLSEALGRSVQPHATGFAPAGPVGKTSGGDSGLPAGALTGLTISGPTTIPHGAQTATAVSSAPTTLQALQQGVLPVSDPGALQQANATSDWPDAQTTGLAREGVSSLVSGLMAGGQAFEGEQSSPHDSGPQAQTPAPSTAMPMGRAETAPAGQAFAKLAQAATQSPQNDPQNSFDALSEKLSTEMAARMHEQLQRGEWKMKFGLRPAHLGGVEIQLEMKDGQLQANLQVDNPVARDLLQQNSARLREALANLGIENPHVHVGQHSSHAGGQSHGNSSNRPQVGDNSAAGSTETGAEETNAARRRPDPQSMLDLYA